MVGFGIIGCGHHASTVIIPNLYTVPGAQVIGVCDLVEARADAVFKERGGRYVTTDHRRILDDPSIQAVSIITGPQFHPQLCIEAAEAGKHIFVEKPIALELDDALRVVRAVEKAGVLLQYGLCNRLAPMVRLAKRMCPKPTYSFCQCPGSPTHQACHNLDLAVNLFHEAPLERVYASGGQFYGITSDRHLPADSFSAVLTFADGSTHTYLSTGDSFNRLLTKYYYQLFSGGLCIYLAERFKKCHFIVDDNKEIPSWGFTGPDTERGRFGYMGHYEELEELVECVLSGEGRPSMTVRDAATVLAVEKAIMESIVSKKPVDFQNFLAVHGVTPEPRLPYSNAPGAES